MVEFTLVLPLLLVLMFGVVQFGIAFHDYISITDAARAGARKAAVSRQATDPVGDTEAAVRASAANLDQAKLAVSVASSWQHGLDVTVTASYPYAIKLLGLYVYSGQLKSKVTERVE